MDVLDDIFDTLKLKAVLYYRTEFYPPWGVDVPAYQQVARFHLVVKGRCYVVLKDGTSVVLEAGDLVLIPHGAEHSLVNDLSAPGLPLEHVLQQSNYDGGSKLLYGKGAVDKNTQLICGHFTFRNGADHALIRALPSIMYVCNAKRMQSPFVDHLLRLVMQQAYSDHEGHQTSVVKLTEVVFIELIRLMAAYSPEISDILAAFADPKIGTAVKLIHESPESPWTVASLADAVAMSRSRFAKRFHDFMSITPMAYLTNWRLQKAMSLLESSPLAIQQIAENVGYHSSASFTRAFTLNIGVSPSDYRKSVMSLH